MLLIEYVDSLLNIAYSVRRAYYSINSYIQWYTFIGTLDFLFVFSGSGWLAISIDADEHLDFWLRAVLLCCGGCVIVFCMA